MSHLCECWQEELVAGLSIWQADGELCHIGGESLRLETSQLGTINCETHTHTQKYNLKGQNDWVAVTVTVAEHPFDPISQGFPGYALSVCSVIQIVFCLGL